MAEWSDRRIERLRQLWDSGKTASEIRSVLNREFWLEGELTRNAVIGKAHRLGLSKRASPISRPARQPAWESHGDKVPAKPKRARKPRAAPSPRKPKPAAPPPAAQPNSYVPAPRAPSRDGCRWPIGDPREPDFHWCNAKPVVQGKPYCKGHCAIAYVPLGRTRVGEGDDEGDKGAGRKVA